MVPNFSFLSSYALPCPLLGISANTIASIVPIHVRQEGILVQHYSVEYDTEQFILGIQYNLGGKVLWYNTSPFYAQ